MLLLTTLCLTLVTTLRFTTYYRNGEKYIGDWLRNRKNGRGVLEYPSGAVYNG